MSIDEAGSDLWDTLSGAELIQAMGEGRFPEMSDVGRHIGQRVVAAEPGRVELAWTPGEHLCNPAGGVHGGYIAMILDNAVCFAGASTGKHFVPQLTLSLTIDYLRGVQAGEAYTVVSTCVKPGRSRLFSTAVITDGQGRPVAQASGSTLPNQAFAR
ncbi:PaaI family thioesterase [Spirillospora sp. NPDC048911]|uniref:PaaI family thioesterase n=1 Tax=Spirillospora sp. NPDC048911 TaxID=3364527 RepID=UPI0037237085